MIDAERNANAVELPAENDDAIVYAPVTLQEALAHALAPLTELGQIAPVVSHELPADELPAETGQWQGNDDAADIMAEFAIDADRKFIAKKNKSKKADSSAEPIAA
jgi:hypothetical protein